jgi:Tol biopolymer transport system component
MNQGYIMKPRFLWMSLVLVLMLACNLRTAPAPTQAPPDAQIPAPTGGTTPSPASTSTALPATSAPSPTLTVTRPPTPTAVGGLPGQFIGLSFGGDSSPDAVSLFNADFSKVKDLWNIPDPAHSDVYLRLSPKADQVAILVCPKERDPKTNRRLCDLYLMTVADAQVTKTAFQLDTMDVQWFPDETRLFANADQGTFGPHDPYPHGLVFFDPHDSNSPNNVRQLTGDEIVTGSLAPDGKKFAYIKRLDTLRVSNLQQTEDTLIEQGDSEYFLHGWSPDGSRLVFSTLGKNEAWLPKMKFPARLVVTSPDGKWRKELAKELGVQTSYATVFFSPDGKQILFTTRDSKHENSDNVLWVVPADGSKPPEKIAVNTGNACWNPDGSEIFFHGWSRDDINTKEGSYMIHPDGSGLTAIPDIPYCNIQWLPGSVPDYEHRMIATPLAQTPLPTSQATPQAPTPTAGAPEPTTAFSPVDSGKIIYGSCATACNIFEINADGTKPHPLTSTALAFSPVWSPDGQQILFTDLHRNLFVMNSNGSKAREIIPGNKAIAGGIGMARWSPDGTRVLFSARPAGSSIYISSNVEIFSAKADGTDLQQMTHDDQPNSGPDWSPDGKSIVYEEEPIISGGGEYHIVAADPDGKNPRDLLSVHAPDMVFHPRWSHDGKRIAFIECHILSEDRNEPADCELMMMDADGSHPHPLNIKNVESASLSWSPDSQKLVYSVCSQPDCNGLAYIQLSIVNLDGTNPHLLPLTGPTEIGASPRQDIMPDWAP